MAAKAARLSPYHFHRMFKLAFGQTPMQFLQECRLAAARRLLVATDQSVTLICFAVGFESLGSFSWLFRKRFGLSPRRFRAQCCGRGNPQD
jgi:AraC-like DNA-binding protein